MLASALGRNVCHGTFEDFQQRLLHALARDIARDGRVFGLSGDLIHFIDVDDAALGKLHIKIRRLQKPQQNVFHILAHVARFGQRGCIGDGKRNIQNLCQRLGKERLAGAGGPDHEDVALLQLDVGLLREVDAFIMIINRHGQCDFCLVLSDDVTVHICFDFLRGREGIGKLQILRFTVFHFVAQDARTKIDALVADIYIRTGNNPVDLFLPLAAERAADGISCHGPSPLNHSLFARKSEIRWKSSGKEGQRLPCQSFVISYR